jgi:hypothetical protein
LIFLVDALPRLGDEDLHIYYYLVAETLLQRLEKVVELLYEAAEKLRDQLRLHPVGQFLVQVEFIVDQ